MRKTRALRKSGLEEWTIKTMPLWLLCKEIGLRTTAPISPIYHDYNPTTLI
jgi:hypothetical protein